MGLVVLGLALAAAILLLRASAVPGPAQSPQASEMVVEAEAAPSCQRAWPYVPVPCERARSAVSLGARGIDQTRIWLTTLQAVKDTLHPRQQTPEPSSTTPVWVFIYDGDFPAITYQDESGNLVRSASDTRALQVVDATDPATVEGAFIFLMRWAELGNPAVPVRLPLPTDAQLEAAASATLRATADPLIRDRETWTTLASRPLQFPGISQGSPCPVTVPQPISAGLRPALGAGPIYAVMPNRTALRPESRSPDGWYQVRVIWISTEVYAGTALVRGARLDGSGELAFGPSTDGTETELHLPSQAFVYSPGVPREWRQWPSELSVRKPGCYGLQVDAETFSEVIVFEVTP
jgi:hypothetical protein